MNRFLSTVDGTVYGFTNLTPKNARKLAADLLTFAGPERPMALHMEDSDGCKLRVRRACDNRSVVVVTDNCTGTLLLPAQVDSLVEWLKGHREDNP